MRSTEPEMCQRVLDMILMYPENHDQGDWATLVLSRDPATGRMRRKPKVDDLCSATLCVCGHAALLAGVLEYRGEGTGYYAAYVDGVDAGEMSSGEWVTLGAKILGLRWSDADHLFHHVSNDAAKEILKGLANGEDVEIDCYCNAR